MRLDRAAACHFNLRSYGALSLSTDRHSAIENNRCKTYTIRFITPYQIRSRRALMNNKYAINRDINAFDKSSDGRFAMRLSDFFVAKN